MPPSSRELRRRRSQRSWLGPWRPLLIGPAVDSPTPRAVYDFPECASEAAVGPACELTSPVPGVQSPLAETSVGEASAPHTATARPLREKSVAVDQRHSRPKGLLKVAETERSLTVRGAKAQTSGRAACRSADACGLWPFPARRERVFLVAPPHVTQTHLPDGRQVQRAREEVICP